MTHKYTNRDEENLETNPLSPSTEHHDHFDTTNNVLYDDMGQQPVLLSMSREPLRVLSSPPSYPYQQRGRGRRHGPALFTEASIDRRVKTPTMLYSNHPTHHHHHHSAVVPIRASSISTSTSSSSSLNHSVSTNSTQPNTNMYRLSEVSSSSHLFGERIRLDEHDHDECLSTVSSVVDSLAPSSVPPAAVAAAAAQPMEYHEHDIETGFHMAVPPSSPDYSTDSHLCGIASSRNSSRSSRSSLSLQHYPQPRQQQQQRQLMIPAAVKHFGSKLNQEVIQASHVTQAELANVVRITKQQGTVFLRPMISKMQISSSSKSSDDLSVLQKLHRQKIQQLTNNVQHEDHFDFCLVLTPQAVYEYWADLLDFRAEQLGEEQVHAVDSLLSTSLSPGTQETDNSDEPLKATDDDDHHHHGADTIDARPFMTPNTGIRQRRRGQLLSDNKNGTTISSVVKETPRAPHTAPPRDSLYSTARITMSLDDSGRKVVKPRLSMFERAVGVFSPPKQHHEQHSCGSQKDLLETTTLTPDMSKETPVVTSRRRWGNRNATSDTTTPDLFSPPVRALLRRNSSLKKRRITIRPMTPSMMHLTPLTNNEEKEELTTATASDAAGSKRRRRNPNSLEIDDIPTQIIPRGIAARTNGMMEFLHALKRGIAVRRHRPGAEAVFLKLFSTDGGDTIKYQQIDDEEAMLAFKEQRVRYNRKLFNRSSPSAVRSVEKRWGQKQATGDVDELQSFMLPDYIAAKQYRQRFLKDQAGVSKKMTDLASKVANSGLVRTADIIAVHPARHEDPRTSNGELGTASLRRSKSEYYTPHTFSIVTRVPRSLGKGKLTNSVASEKWHAGEGNDAQFKIVDIETATEGEYWLVFRGFLLLHRDAASGRYAAQRAAGFGNTYNRRDNATTADEMDSPHDILHKDEFKEPPTVGLMERVVAKIRKVDTSYMEGSVAPNAVPPPSDYFLGFRSPGTQIWSRLRYAGLETQRIYALDTRRVMIKVRCPSDRLTDVAEVLRLKLRTRDGSFAPFHEHNVAIFQPLNDRLDTPSTLHAAAALFKSSERQTIIDFIIRSRIRDSGAELGETTDLGKMIDSRVPLHMHDKLNYLFNVWFYFWRRENWEGRDGKSMSVDQDQQVAQSSASAISSNHSTSATDDDTQITTSKHNDMPNFFVRFMVGSLYQPLDSIEQYFGENVAFYFAWLQHCSVHLAVLSVPGLIVFICQLTSGHWDHWSRPVFAVYVMLWSFIVMVNWRKRSNFLAHRWGTMNYIEQETTRPQFKGEYRKDEITSEWVVYYTSWKRWLKYLISFPLTITFTVGTLVVILLVHANRDQMLAQYINEKSVGSQEFHFVFSVTAIGNQPVESVQTTRELLLDPAFWFITAGLPSLLGLCLPLMNFILMRVSIVLNDFENYRTESEYRTHLIIKVFSFRFVCYFATLYYYAFMYTGSAQAIENGILRVGTGVLVYVTVAHWWGAFLQTYFPLFFRRILLYRQRNRLRDELKLIELEESELECSTDLDDEVAKETKVNLINRRLLLDQAQDEVWEEMMLPMHDSFPEYIQAVVLFAFVTCFSVVLPITPFICLINHLLSMRFDAFKLCRGRRRPLAHKTGGIGVWEHVLHIVTVIAVLTNCWLMGFTNEKIYAVSSEDSIGTLGLFALVVGWEHIMLLIKYVMTTSISHLPKSVREEMKKEQFLKDLKRNSTLRAKNGRRRSQYKRQTSSVLDSEGKSISSKGLSTSSFRQPHDLKSVPSTGSDRGLHTIASGTESESSSPLEATANSRQASHATRPISHPRSTSVESPFELYPSRQSFATPEANEPSMHESNGNMSALLGDGLDENASLATPAEKQDSSSSFKRVKRTKDIEDAAAERIRIRLKSLEEKMHSREHND